MKTQLKNSNSWKMRYSLILALLLLGAATAVSLYQIYFTNRITITNNAPVKANEVIVSVCGNDVVFKNIDPGSTHSQTFAISGDSSFSITASFDDGTKAKHLFGYVTGGAGAYGNKAEIEFTPAKAINAKQD